MEIKNQERELIAASEKNKVDIGRIFS